MKKIFYSLTLMIICVSAGAQKWQELNNRYKHRRSWSDSLLRIPHGVTPVLHDVIDVNEPGALYWRQDPSGDTALYGYNGTTWLKIGSSSGSGGTFYTNDYGLLLSSNAFKVDTNVISTRAWRQKGIDSVSSLFGSYYTKTQVNNFFNGGVSISGYNKAQWDSAFAGMGSTLTFTGGLGKDGNEVYAQYYNPYWNANRIQGLFVDAARPGDHTFLGMDSVNGVLRWMPLDSMIELDINAQTIYTTNGNITGNRTLKGAAATYGLSLDSLASFALHSLTTRLYTKVGSYTNEFNQANNDDVGQNMYSYGGSSDAQIGMSRNDSSWTAFMHASKAGGTTARRTHLIMERDSVVFYRWITAGADALPWKNLDFRVKNLPNKTPISTDSSVVVDAQGRFWLTAYSAPSTPTLQQVTDEGDTTNHSLGAASYYIRWAGANVGGVIPYGTVGAKGAAFQAKDYNSAFSSTIIAGSFSADWLATLPNKSGTIAMLDDIPAAPATPTLAQVIAAGNTLAAGTTSINIPSAATFYTNYNNTFSGLYQSSTSTELADAATSAFNDYSQIILKHDGTGIGMYALATGGTQNEMRIHSDYTRLRNDNGSGSLNFQLIKLPNKTPVSTDSTLLVDNAGRTWKAPYSSGGSGGYTTLQSYVTTSTTSGTSNQDILTYTLPANTLTTNGDAVEIYFEYTTTGGASANVVNIKVNAHSFSQHSETSTMTGNIRLTLTRISATSFRISGSCAKGFSGAVSPITNTYSEQTSGVDFATAVTIVFNATSPNGSGQVSTRHGRITKLAAP